MSTSKHEYRQEALIIDDTMSNYVTQLAAESSTRGIEKIGTQGELKFLIGTAFNSKSRIVIAPEVSSDIDPMSLFGLLLLVNPKLDRYEFSERYCDGKWSEGEWKQEKCTNKSEFKMLMATEYIMVNNTKENELNEDSEMVALEDSGIAANLNATADVYKSFYDDDDSFLQNYSSQQ